MNVAIIVAWLICVFIDGMNAGLAFSQSRIGTGIMWTLSGVVWGVLICLRVL